MAVGGHQPLDLACGLAGHVARRGDRSTAENRGDASQPDAGGRESAGGLAWEGDQGSDSGGDRHVTMLEPAANRDPGGSDSSSEGDNGFHAPGSTQRAPGLTPLVEP